MALRGHRTMAHCGRMVRDSAMITMESLKETNIALSNSAIADLLRRLFLQKLVPSALPGTNSRRVLPPVEYNNCFCLRMMSPFAKLLWPLLLVKATKQIVLHKYATHTIARSATAAVYR